MILKKLIKNNKNDNILFFSNNDLALGSVALII